MDKEKKQKEKLFQNVAEISEGRKKNTINLAERKMKIFYMTNIPWKTRKWEKNRENREKENELEEGEINGETEMDEILEGVEVGEVE